MEKKHALAAGLVAAAVAVGAWSALTRRNRATSDSGYGPPLPEVDVMIVPTIPEWQEHSSDYLELSEAITTDLGLSAAAEDRGAPHSGSDVPDFVPLGFLVYVGVKLADPVVDALVERVMRIVVDRAKARWWTKGKEVEGVIYGPNHEVLRRVTWESTEGEQEWIDHN